MHHRTLNVLVALLSLGAGAQAAPGDKAPATGPTLSLSVEPFASWANPGDTPMPVDVARPPEDPIFVQLGRDGRPYRILIPRSTPRGLHIDLPPGSTVELWKRKDFIERPHNPFETAARWEAVPRIVVGPMRIEPGPKEGLTVEIPAWSSASGAFRAFPEGEIPVTVHVNNTGIGAWNRPRVRLFAPDNWSVTPEVADVISPAKKAPREDAPSITEGKSGVLPPTMTGMAFFTVKIPKRAVIGSTAPLVAFLRYESGGQVVTVQNSVDVTIQEPIERRYAMNEAGEKVIVRLINRFAPFPLGTPTVEVRRPAGTEWTVTPPKAVEVRGDADAVAPVAMPTGDASPASQIAVPVVVTLNGLRMGYTPVVHTSASYGKPNDSLASENGVRLLREAAPVELTDAGVCPVPGAEERRFAFDVAERFAVSNPAQFLSPTWVTVTFTNKDATRIRLEYDAFGSDAPAVAADRPIAVQVGATTMTFLLPDARFGNRLPGQSDLTLTASGGDLCLQSIAVSKWNTGKG